MKKIIIKKDTESCVRLFLMHWTVCLTELTVSQSWKHWAHDVMVVH